MINNDGTFPQSMDFILNTYEGICQIIELHKESPILYDVLNYIIIKTEYNDENNLLFFSDFYKVFLFIKKILVSENNSY